MKAEIYIGIDPDVEKSGLAIWDKTSQKLTVDKYNFFSLYEGLRITKQVDEIKAVRIEAGWLNAKSNFHYHPKQSKFVGERIAKNVGSNHQVGRLIGEMCEHLGIQYEFVKPMGKVTPEYFQQLTGIKVKKSDQDMIDAGMLVYGL